MASDNKDSGGNTVQDLRSILFETMRGIRDKKISVEDAKCIAQNAAVIIESVKTEVLYYKMLDDKDKKPVTFFPQQGKVIDHE